MKNLFLILAVVLLASCATSPRENSLRVVVGNTTDQVSQVMGVPLDRQLKGDDEAWTYGSIAGMGTGEYTVIWFKTSRVTGITSYRNFTSFGVLPGIKTIIWEEAPDAVVEVRNR